MVPENLRVLDINRHGPVREIRLNRPPANALNAGLVKALATALEQAAGEADAVVISGMPGMFSAGLDVPALLQLDRNGMLEFWSQFNDLMRRIAFMPIPVAFALTGHAPAGGIVLALYGDYRIMSSGNFKTGLNEVQVGLVVSPVIQGALLRLTGIHPGERLLVTGSMLSPDQALDVGLVDEIQADPDATVARAIAWPASRCVSVPGQVV